MYGAYRIPDGYKQNFETLLRACDNGDVALVASRRASNGERVLLVCAISRGEGDEVNIVPLAEMVNGDPYELYIAPDDLDESALTEEVQ